MSLHINPIRIKHLFSQIISNRRIQIYLHPKIGGDGMGDCELCGAMKVSTREVKTGRASVMACMRCSERFDVQKKSSTPSRPLNSSSFKPRPSHDIMRKQSTELAPDFGKRIMKARKRKNWTVQELGKKMAETVNVVKSAEAGKRPTDSVISKFEKILEISLMIESNDDQNNLLSSSMGRGLTLGDYLNDLGE